MHLNCLQLEIELESDVVKLVISIGSMKSSIEFVSEIRWLLSGTNSDLQSDKT